MKESKTFEGRWWIFGTEKPEHFGVLHYSPEKGLRLEVKIAQAFRLAEILQEKTPVDFPEVIQGRDKDDKPITLFGNSGPSWNKSGGLASYEFHPLIAIVGQSVESWSAANYQKVEIRLPRENIPANSSKLKAFHQIRLRGAAFTPLHLTQTSTRRNFPNPRPFAG